MGGNRENWDKPRKKSEHFTAAEIAFIRECFVNRYRVEYCAEKLKCATRTATQYYADFRAQGVKQETVPLRRRA